MLTRATEAIVNMSGYVENNSTRRTRSDDVSVSISSHRAFPWVSTYKFGIISSEQGDSLCRCLAPSFFFTVLFMAKSTMARSGPSTVHEAAERGDLEALQRFIEEDGVDVESKNDRGETPLFVATRGVASNADIVRYLIGQNANVNVVSEDGYFSPLMAACEYEHVELVPILLEHGADVHFESQSGWTALIAVTHTHNPACSHLVPMLLQYGADPNARATNIGMTPLLNLCVFCNVQDVPFLANQLLLHGADVQAKKLDGNTALHDAVIRSPELVHILISHGADVNAANILGFTPLHRLSSSDYFLAWDEKMDILQALLDSNANLMARETDITVLHVANPDVNENFVRAVLNHCRTSSSPREFRAFLLQANQSGYTVLHMAPAAGFTQLLVEQPREDGSLLPVCYEMLTAKCAKGMSPLEKARREHLPTSINHYDKLRLVGTIEYLDSFVSLPLAVPGVSTTPPPKKKRRARRRKPLTVKLNPSLNNFQAEIAGELLTLIRSTTGFPDLIAYGILGYLTPVDVMKRSDE